MICLLLAACTSGSDFKSTLSDKENIKGAELIQDSIGYELDDSLEGLIAEEHHLYGKFQCDRMAFHVVEDPEIIMEGATVEQATLYLLDDSLFRKKYQLNTNISAGLIAKYGGFKFKSLHPDTKRMAKEEGVLTSHLGRNVINPKLKKYQLKWLINNEYIIFQHKEDSLLVENIYIEEKKEYQSLVKSIYNQLQ